MSKTKIEKLFDDYKKNKQYSIGNWYSDSATIPVHIEIRTPNVKSDDDNKKISTSASKELLKLCEARVMKY